MTHDDDEYVAHRIHDVFDVPVDDVLAALRGEPLSAEAGTRRLLQENRILAAAINMLSSKHFALEQRVARIEPLKRNCID